MLFFALAGSLLAAQSGVSISGQVTDPSGSVIPGARVFLARQRGATRTAETDQRGQYQVQQLAPGVYLVSATAPNLATAAPLRVPIAGEALRLDLRLEITALKESLKVEEDPPPTTGVDPASNATGMSLKGEDLQALSDDPEDLQADLRALAGPSAGPSGAAILIDGFRGGELPPKNSVREVRINQNPFSPEYEKLGYGRIEIFTKPGAAKHHATADYNFATDAWNTRNPYSSVKAPFLLNEFEGGLSGPLGKKASYSLDAQHNLVDNGFVINAVTVDPRSFAIASLGASSKTPQRFTRLSPRLDYQFNDNHFLFMRYGATHIDIDGAGVGGFDLNPRGYHSRFTNQTFQIAETATFGQILNETRFQFYRSYGERFAKNADPAIIVLDSFSGGGSPLGQNLDVSNSYELQNYTSAVHKAHTMRFGVRLAGQTDDNTSPQNFNGAFTFGGGLSPSLDAASQPLRPISSIERYRRTVLLISQGLSPERIRALGGGATQFTLSTGIPNSAVRQFDAALFFGDDWRIRSNLLVSLGLRYEVQSNIHDWLDFAPRLSVAWSPQRLSARRKTVLRAGSGLFYDRFALANSLTAARYNGVVQQQFVVANPDFFPVVPPISSLMAYQSSQIVQRIAPALRAPRFAQTAVSLERQLTDGVTVAMTYTNSSSSRILRSRVETAGSNPPSGPLFLMTSAGRYRQNQLVLNTNAKLGKSASLFGVYAWNRARSDSDGLGTFSANPASDSGEYGPASTDVRHRSTIGGSISMLWNVHLSPFLILQSGAPFNITAGSDLYGTSLFNGRPGIPTDLTKPGLIQTSYGWLDPKPSPGDATLGRNFGRGPGLITANFRITKAIGLGPLKGGGSLAGKAAIPAAGADPGGAGGAPTGRTIRGLLGSSASDRRYNLILGLSARNILNHNNPGPIVGNITSPLFGRSNQTNVLPNGEGFSESANNRRLEMQIRFTF